MTTTELGKRSAVAHDDAGHSGPNPKAKFKLTVEKLGVAAPPAHVEFIYSVNVTGMLERIVRSTTPGGPSILIVDGAAHLVPAGTLVDIETGEIR